jgi:heme/copper-type cytochrome/quinol oxidase subunit 4
MKKYLIGLGLIGCVILGIIGFLLTKKTPFGLVFNFSLIFIVLGLLSFLAYFAFTWYQKSQFKKIVATLIGLLTILLAVIVVIGSIDVRLLIPSISSQTLTKEQWVEDIEFLDETLHKHPAYNDSLGGIVSNLRFEVEKTRTLDDYQAIQAAMKMVSTFKDGHSYVMPFQLYLKTRYLPIQTYEFEDGVYITASKHKDLVGGKIVSINNHRIEDLLNGITPLIGADNSSFTKYQSAMYIPNLDILKILDSTTSTAEANIKVVVNDKEITENIASVTMQRWLFWSLAPTDDWRPVGHNIRSKKNNVVKKNDTLLYMTFNQTGPEAVLTEIGNNLRNEVYGSKIKHLIIDMRNNTGGDNTSYNDLIKALTEVKIDLTLFTSRKTFSAGINFISELKLKRNFRIIGEQTGAGHNHYGDAQTIFLPHSGLMLSISTREWAFIPEIHENTIEPDQWIRYTSSDYFSHADPWMNAFQYSSNQMN